MEERIDTAGVVADLMEKWHQAKVLEVEHTYGGETVKGKVALLPSNAGVQLVALKDKLDPFRTRPENKVGTAKLESLESLILHANRFKGDSSAIFCTLSGRPSIQVVVDYHEAGSGSPRWCKHRALYEFPFSKEWLAWSKVSASPEPMTQSDFARFLEERVVDVIPPEQMKGEHFDDIELVVAQLDLSLGTPSRLVQISRELEVHTKRHAMEARNLGSGEVQLIFQEEHTDRVGAQLKLPGAFVIGIPLFLHSNEAWPLLVRLFFRNNGGFTFKLALHRSELVFEKAIKECAERVAKETDLELFYGTPES